MKALSLRQPWAHAVIHLGKRIENRDWRGCSYRGEILIHASKNVGTRAEFDGAVETIRDVTGLVPEMCLGFAEERGGRWVPSRELWLGGIVGRARIIGTIDDERGLQEASVDISNKDTCSGGWLFEQREWWMGGFALVLTDVEPLPFKPCAGSLGFFEVEYP